MEYTNLFWDNIKSKKLILLLLAKKKKDYKKYMYNSMHYNLNSNEYGKLFIFLVFNFILATNILFISKELFLNKPDFEKLSAYECGFEPYEDARNIFDIHFYVIAILFLIFDLETSFLFPGFVSLGYLSNQGFFSLLDFILELFIGFIYVLFTGVLDLKKK